MKKREWDKDIFNYDKAREWLGKNHLPVIFFLAILAIPVLFMATRFAFNHFPSIPDASIASKITKDAIDFVTPALYYFSSIAQTMGAIIGLALAAMYAIMPNIRSSKDNPAFEPARRLLQRDEYFRRSINVGSVCILVSLLGLLFIYITASSQSWAFILLLFLGATALALGVYSLGTMFYFIRVRMPKYFSPVEILEFAFENGDPNKIRAMNERDALDYAEICLSLSFEEIIDERTQNFILFLLTDINLNDEREINLNKIQDKYRIIIENTFADYNKIGLGKSLNVLNEKSLWLKILSVVYLIKNDYHKNNSQLFDLIIFYIKRFLVFKATQKQYFEIIKLDDTINSLVDYYFVKLYKSSFKLVVEFISIFIKIAELKGIINPQIINNLNSFYNFINTNPKYSNDNEYFNIIPILNLTLGIIVYTNNVNEIVTLLHNKIPATINFEYIKSICFKNGDKIILNKIFIVINNIDKIEMKVPSSLKNIVDIKSSLLSYEYEIRFFLDMEICYINVMITDISIKYDREDNIKYLDTQYIENFNFALAYCIYKNVFKPKIKNFKGFIYFHFIPYLERHGINVNDNPEYIAIIRKRIKEIKEPELDF